MSSWADKPIKTLLSGKLATVRPKGNSMHPRIKSGQEVTLRPIKEDEEILPGSIVLCKVKGTHYLHLVSGIKDGRKGKPPSYRISNNHGHVNGWIHQDYIYGKAIEVK